MHKRKFLNNCVALSIGAIGTISTMGLQAHAQDFPPKKTVTMVVGFAAGGATRWWT